jgi:hypothetical protein
MKTPHNNRSQIILNKGNKDSKFINVPSSEKWKNAASINAVTPFSNIPGA